MSSSPLALPTGSVLTSPSDHFLAQSQALCCYLFALPPPSAIAAISHSQGMQLLQARHSQRALLPVPSSCSSTKAMPVRAVRMWPSLHQPGNQSGGNVIPCRESGEVDPGSAVLRQTKVWLCWGAWSRAYFGWAETATAGSELRSHGHNRQPLRAVQTFCASPCTPGAHGDRLWRCAAKR